MSSQMKKFCAVCVGVLCFVVCLPSAGWADTNAGGAISANTVWNTAGSPYIVTENVTVNAGVTLTVNPGVTVKFNSAMSLTVNGTLTAGSSSGAAVTFTSSSTAPAAGAWEGILKGFPKFN